MWRAPLLDAAALLAGRLRRWWHVILVINPVMPPSPELDTLSSSPNGDDRPIGGGAIRLMTAIESEWPKPGLWILTAHCANEALGARLFQHLA
jgi:hypothetical protein